MNITNQNSKHIETSLIKNTKEDQCYVEDNCKYIKQRKAWDLKVCKTKSIHDKTKTLMARGSRTDQTVYLLLQQVGQTGTQWQTW